MSENHCYLKSRKRFGQNFLKDQIIIDDIIFKGHILFRKFDKKGRDWLVFIYRAHSFSGKQLQSNPEGNLIRNDNDKLLELNLWDGDKEFLPHVYGEKSFNGTFNYKDGKLSHFNLDLLDN